MGHYCCRVAQLGVEVLRKGFAEAAHQIAHHAGPADLGERAGQHVAHGHIDAGCLGTRDARDVLEAVVDAARDARAAFAVSAAPFDDLAMLGRDLAQATLTGEARRDGADLDLQAAFDLVALRRAFERHAGHAAGDRRSAEP